MNAKGWYVCLKKQQNTQDGSTDYMVTKHYHQVADVFDEHLSGVFWQKQNPTVWQCQGWYAKAWVIYGRTLKAVKEIVRICRNKNLLKDYLTERETEVEGIMLTLFNQERVFDIEKK